MFGCWHLGRLTGSFLVVCKKRVDAPVSSKLGVIMGSHLLRSVTVSAPLVGQGRVELLSGSMVDHWCLVNLTGTLLVGRGRRMVKMVPHA